MLRRLGHDTTTPAGVRTILLAQGCHSSTIIRGYEWNRWARRYVGILVINKIPVEIILKVMKKRGNLDFTKEKIEEIESQYKSIISALKESGNVYGEACDEYIRQAYDLGFLMRDICVQLEKAGFIGITREIVRDVLVQYGYNHEGVIPGRLGTIREGRPESEKSENYVTSAYAMGISIDDIAFHLHILGFEFDCYNYIFNTLVGHGLLLTDDSTITSSTGAITPRNLDELEDDFAALDDLEDLEGYDDTISNFEI